jgi:RHS repeat-associated protein
MGRPQVAQQRQGPSSTWYDSVETDYDSNGRVSRVTAPYNANLGGTNGTIVSTTYLYDAVNRPTSITSPIGMVKSFTYTGGASTRDTLVGLNVGPNGEHKQTQYEYDGLGRVTSVCEVTSASTYGCGQATAQTGFFTKYSYSAPGNLLSITQNVGGSPTQTRSFTYENSNTGRMLTATTPEAGTVYTTYDTDGVCGTFVGAVVKKSDNGGGTTCLQYDLLHRVTLKTYTGLNSAVTPSKTFVYDSSASNPSINCPTGGSNQLGRLAEVSTGSAGIFGGTDEGFCYDVVGNTTDYFQNDGSAWTHSIESYFPTGIPQTLAVATQPTITYGLDAMARIYSAGASGTGQDPLTSVSYNIAGLPLTVTFGSGDTSAYTWKQGVGPMATANFTVGSSSITDTLTWNANGTLQKLIIVDPLNSTDDETCTYSYDDLQRILTDNCGSTTWNQTFSYDPFGNVKKTGNPGNSWSPVYDQTTNRYQSIGATYDANGRLINDTFDSPIGWDIDGNIVGQTGVNFAYDGLGRTAGSVVSNVWTNYFYAPDGGLMGTVTNGGAIQKMFVPLPMSTAVYNNGTLQHYRRNDWQGSVRVASTPSKTAYSITAYGAFGEAYGASGSTNKQFAGLTSDISSGTEQVSLSRRYHPGQGRWLSPDGGIPNLLNPQTFNAYHYALNSPTNSTDPGGNLDDNSDFGAGAVDVSVPEDPSVTQDPNIIAGIQNSGVYASANFVFNAGDNFGAGAVDVSSIDVSSLEITGEGVSGTANLNGPAGGASGGWGDNTMSFSDAMYVAGHSPVNSAVVSPILGFVGGIGEAQAAGEFVSLYHASIDNGMNIVAHGLDSSRGVTWVTPEIETARDTLLNHGDVATGKVSARQGMIIESRVPNGEYNTYFKQWATDYTGWRGTLVDPPGTQITLRMQIQFEIFNRFRVIPWY